MSDDIKIALPSLDKQKRIILEQAIHEGVETLTSNLEKPVFDGPNIDESQYPDTHLLTMEEGWEPPHNDIVAAYFDNVKDKMGYSSDKDIAWLLGITTDRQIRRYKSGESKVPYGIWRKFLILTGRVPQEVYPILGYFEK